MRTRNASAPLFELWTAVLCGWLLLPALAAAQGSPPDSPPEPLNAGTPAKGDNAPSPGAAPDVGFPRGDRISYDTTLGWRFPNPRLAEQFPLESMGETGENVAERWGVSREEQDAFALRSQRRWAAAA